MQNKKQKESLSVMIAKTTLVIAILTGLGTIIFGGGVVIMKYYNSEVNNSKPFKQLPVLCKNNFDCPLQMKCENFICVDVGCIKEGGSFPPPISPKYTNHMATKCCEDLKRITASKYYDGDCNIQMYPVGGSISICSNCGNGICEENLETKCNCPEDCGEQSDTSDWQTYRNEEFGFEVKYPEEWTAISPNLINNLVNFGVRNGSGVAVVSVIILGEKNIQEEINKRELEMKVIDKNALITESEVLINNIKAKQIKLLYQPLGSFPESLEISTYFNYGNNLYTIHLSAYKRTEQETIDIYNSFLSTFKFIEN